MPISQSILPKYRSSLNGTLVAPTSGWYSDGRLETAKLRPGITVAGFVCSLPS